ncbi:TetR/AcrR family transcriptional regulator [Gephyromycinifex aptenodytis]|uniref:TetR/AcrR family transcriptional regulator n=1 Tax=Gephyromycinifex aptenodytis TaxID=2716227 RepID=UPI0014450B36|nr:TetR/AcrR family transcriptional regulator [Gephyromycinifex aptenodytis]
MSDGYHHGNLRRALLDAAVAVIAESGPSSVSLRDLARRVGVSHAAPAHHFGDRPGLLTALAVEGFCLLTTALRQAAPRGFDEVAVAYVRFARRHRAHYAVMHRLDLAHATDPDLLAARAEASRQLAEGVQSLPHERRRFVTVAEGGYAAWALVHGLASLAAEGAIPAGDLEELTLRAARQLFG